MKDDQIILCLYLVFWGSSRKMPVPFLAIPSLEGVLPSSLAQLEPHVPSRGLMTCRFIPRQLRDLPPSRKCLGNDHLIQKEWFHVLTCEREICHMPSGPKRISQSFRCLFPLAWSAQDSVVTDPTVIKEQHWRPRQPEICPAIMGTSVSVIMSLTFDLCSFNLFLLASRYLRRSCVAEVLNSISSHYVHLHPSAVSNKASLHLDIKVYIFPCFNLTVFHRISQGTDLDKK